MCVLLFPAAHVFGVQLDVPSTGIFISFCKYFTVDFVAFLLIIFLRPEQSL